MYIEQIIISGFKSYRDYTVIDGFDPYFNAITGRNGSGKSNIFDAICWVLGMGNISNLRADGMQGLIYKGGTSGPKQASVEIIFNNEDKNAGPISYRNFDKISVKRTVSIGSGNTTTPSKYYINGALAAASRVQNLFRSVQLNVNNPHFLIQQGRIIKILNMHPPEILKLVEEAAGISMFENKKDDAVRTLEKKQHQLDEITRIMTEELIPNLEKLRNDKEKYQAWINSKTEVDRLSRWLIANKYTQCERAINEGDEKVARARTEVEETTHKIEEAQERISELQNSIKELASNLENNTNIDIAELNRKKDKAKEEFDTATIHLKHAEEEIKRLTQKREKLAKQRDEYLHKFEEIDNQLKEREEEHNGTVNEAEQYGNRVKQLEKRITDVNIGIANEEDNSSLSEQIEKTKKLIADIQVQQAKIEKTRPHLIQQRDSLVAQLNAAEREKFNLDQNKERIEKEMSEIDHEIEQLGFDPREQQLTIQERDSKSRLLTQERENLDQLERKIVGINIDFNQKPQDLDESRIYGTVASLLSMKNKKYAIAAESAAGGKLYNIVAEDVETSTKLTREDVLRRRSTVIPLDKIDVKKPSEAAVKKANQIDSTAHLIVDELDFDPHFEKAIRFAFNNILVVDTLDGARKVAFDPNVRMKCVTLEGDIVDPAGTLSGGSRNQNQSSIIENVTNYKNKRQTVDNLKHEIDELNAKLNAMEQPSRVYKDMSMRKEILQHELDLALQSIKNSRAAGIQDQLTKIDDELKTYDESSQNAGSQLEESQHKLESLTSQYNDWNSQRTMKISELERELAEARQKFEEATQKKFKSDNDYESAKVQHQALQENITKAEADIENQNKAIKEQEDIKNGNEEKVSESSARLEKFEKSLKEQYDILAKTNKELNDKKKTEEQESKNLQKIIAAKKSAEATIANATHEKEELKAKIKALVHESPWIEQEKRFFGVAHTDFDFSLYERGSAKKRLKEMTESQKELETTVNKRVMAQFDKASHELDVLQDKRATVEAEKEKILDVIKELEQKKEEALTVTHKKVNADLSDIVSHLLAGAEAYLEDITDEKGVRGFELGVKLTGVKKGLLELSGGQRSLIALGLVLALLKFNPAPIYILDEVDAALDLGHTQDIGRLLRNQFKTSQFIVVSLKEGLYKYANVLFQTSFTDTSHVTRVEQRHD